MTNELPNLPLGLSLRQHMTNYRKGLNVLLEGFREHGAEDGVTPDRVVQAIAEDLDGLLRFVDAENAFYSIGKQDIKPGVMSVRVYQPALAPSGRPYLKLGVSVGELSVATPVLTLDQAERLARGMLSGVARGRELKPE